MRRNLFSDSRLRRFLTPILAHWGMGAAAMTMAALLQAVEPLIGRSIIDEALAKSDSRLFLALLGLLAVIAALSFAFDALGNFLVTVCRERLRIQLQSGLMARIVTEDGVAEGAETPDFSRMSPGEYQQLAMGEVHEASGLLTALPAAAISAFAQFAFIGAVMLLLQPVVGLATLAGSAVLVFFSARLSGRIAGVNMEFLGGIGAVAGKLQQVFGARSLIRRFHRGSENVERFRGLQDSAREGGVRLFCWESLYRLQETAWSTVFSLAVAVITGYAVFKGKTTIGEYIAIQVYVGRIQGPLRTLLSLYKDALKAGDQLRRVLDHGSRAAPAAAGIPVAGQHGSLWGGPLVAEGARLGALGPLSFRIERGARILFAGRPGEPLSEVLDLVSGDCPAEAGTLKVGEHDIHAMPPYYRRRWSATISAEPVLVHGTLRDNLFFGAGPGAADAGEVAGILAATGLTELASGGGLDRVLDPSRLSFPLRHRIQVARALLLRPELLLIEEFAGALDDAVLRELVAAIQGYARTVVAAGSQGALMELVTEVVWLEHGRPAQTADVDGFLFGPHVGEMVSQGKVQSALQGRGALAHAAGWARRNRVGLTGFVVELFGDARLAASELGGVTEAMRAAFRETDVVLHLGKSKVRCVFFDARPDSLDRLEVRLLRTVSRQLRRRGADQVYFNVRREGAVSARDVGFREAS